MSKESRSVRYRNYLRAQRREMDQLFKGTSLDTAEARRHRHTGRVMIVNSVNRLLKDIFREDNLN